jgi:DNA phosphorothioation-dependent restriction protein DptH
MSNLDKDEKDRLFNAAHKLFFRPADTEMRTYAEIASISTGEKLDVWLKKPADL